MPRGLRIIPVGAGQTHRKRDALSITDQMPFASPLSAIGGIDPARASIQKGEKQQIPNALLLPVAQSAPARAHECVYAGIASVLLHALRTLEP